MAEPDAQELCVLNSVDWYCSIARAHGIEYSTVNGIWASPDAMPPYYSNAVTVARSGPEAQLAVVERLLQAIPHTFSVKDSYALLDLAPLGFRPLFDAEWIRLEPGGTSPGGGWRRLTTPEELDRWEAVWRASGSPAELRVFVPALLDDDSVAVLAAGTPDEIVAGVVANRSAGVVGLSNFFATGRDAESHFAGAAAAVTQFAPGLPVVGYEHGDSLERVLRHGFSAAGPLRVWVHAPSGSSSGP